MTWVMVVIKTDVALPALTSTKKSFEENPPNQTDRALK
jgi:hypothetical protein